MPTRQIEAADSAITSLLQWGIGGAILAVFVAPVFFIMVRGIARREEERSQRDDEERRRRVQREDLMLQTLVQSVDQQRAALDQQRAFELEEKAVHAALGQSLAQINASLAQVSATLAEQDRQSVVLTATQERIAQLLEVVSGRMSKP